MDSVSRKQKEHILMSAIIRNPEKVLEMPLDKINFVSSDLQQLANYITECQGDTDFIKISEDTAISVEFLVELFTVYDNFGGSLWSSYMTLLQEDAAKRGEEIVMGAYEKLKKGKDIESTLNDINEGIIQLMPETIDLEAKDEVLNVINDIDDYQKKRENAKGGLIGMPTGFPSMDRATDGFQEGQLVVIGGRSSQGKTTLAVNHMRAALKNDDRCLFFSVEMTKQMIYLRIASMISGYTTKQIKGGYIDKEKRDHIMRSVGKKDFKVFNTHCDDWTKIKSEILRDKMKNKTKAVFIDYLQLLQYQDKRDIDLIDSIIKDMGKFCTKHNITIFLLSQMANDHFGELKDIMLGVPKYRGSGLIFQRANIATEIVGELKREELEVLWEAKKPIPKIVIMHKNRDGSVVHTYVEENSATGEIKEISKGKYEHIISITKQDSVEDDWIEEE